MLKKILLFLMGLSVLLLAGCRGGVLVFKGTHEQQDKALLDKLSEKYPKMSFTCTGQSESAVHTVEDSDGVQFPAWTAAKGGGDFQVLDYYLPEWLRAAGFYERLEEDLGEQGFGWEYGDYNHYDRHLRLDFGELEGPDGLDRAAGVLDRAKELFDGLESDFRERTGCGRQLLYFHGDFAYEGEERSGMFYLSMREDDQWGREYELGDYRAQLRDIIENTDDMDETPNIN